MKLILTVLLRFISAVDYVFRQWVRLFLKPPYKRVGKCKQCGECCRCILISVEPRMLKVRLLRNFAIWWNIYFNDFKLIGCLLEDGYISFSCKKLKANGQCGQYNWLRPWFCYEYPRTFGYFEKPVTLPGCGYKFTSLRK